MPTVFLVHGTYAPDAPWTHEGSPLRKRLESELSPVPIDFRTIEWSGNNRHADRVQAAGKLVQEIEATLDRDSQERILVIGHSHGGSIASMALKASERVKQGLAGCVFISTPFVVASRRDYSGKFEPLYRHLMAQAGLYAVAALIFFGAVHLPRSMEWAAFALFYSIMLWVYLAGGEFQNVRLPGVSVGKFVAKQVGVLASLTVSFSAAIWAFDATVSQGYWRVFAYLAGSVAFFAVGTVLRYALVRLNILIQVAGDIDKITHAVGESLEKFSYPDIAPDKALFIRFTSDEAGLALSAAQALSKTFEIAIKVFLAALSVFTPEFWRVRQRRMSLPQRLAWWALLLVFLALFGKLIIVVPLFIAGFIEAAARYLLIAATAVSLPSYFPLFDASFGVGLLRDYPFLQPDLAPSNGRLAFVYVIVFPILVLVAGMALLARTFGFSYFWAAPLINLSVEPTPPGNSRLLHLTPGDDFTQAWRIWGAISLVHSQGYSDSRALDAIAVFARQRCASEPPRQV